MRNKLAGTKKGKSKSAKYFQDNPDKREKKNQYNSEYHSSEERKKYRAELNRENRKRGKKGDGKDVAHKKEGGFKLQDQKINRSYNGKGKRGSKT